MSQKDISVIMPALNEEASIKAAVESTLVSFEKNSLDGEIVVISDGSTDGTAGIVRDIAGGAKGKVLLLEHKIPMGIGKSFWDGVKKACGEGVTMIPGDNENDPDEVLCYAHLLKSVDAVVPYVVNKEVRPFFRNIVSSIFTRIVNVTFRTSFRYTNGTVIYRTSILKDIKCRSNGFFFQAEALIKVARRKYLIAEVPYFLSRREGGSSKALSLSSFVKVVSGYISLIKDIYISKKYTSALGKLDKNSMRVKRNQ